MTRIMNRWKILEELGMDIWLYITVVRPGVWRACLVNKRTNAIIDSAE